MFLNQKLLELYIIEFNKLDRPMQTGFLIEIGIKSNNLLFTENSTSIN